MGHPCILKNHLLAEILTLHKIINHCSSKILLRQRGSIKILHRIALSLLEEQYAITTCKMMYIHNDYMVVA